VERTRPLVRKGRCGKGNSKEGSNGENLELHDSDVLKNIGFDEGIFFFLLGVKRLAVDRRRN